MVADGALFGSRLRLDDRAAVAALPAVLTDPDPNVAGLDECSKFFAHLG